MRPIAHCARRRHHLRRRPVVAAAVDDAFINFPNGNPNYGLVHDQVIAIDPANGQSPSL